MVPPNRPLNAYVPWPNWQHQWQIDNMPNEVNGISKNQVKRFSRQPTAVIRNSPAPGRTHPAQRQGKPTQPRVRANPPSPAPGQTHPAPSVRLRTLSADPVLLVFLYFSAPSPGPQLHVHDHRVPDRSARPAHRYEISPRMPAFVSRANLLWCAVCVRYVCGICALPGNLGVFSGGHVRVQQALHAAGGVQRFLNEHKDLNDLRRSVGPLPEVTQLVVNPGDVLISHYSVPTIAVPNISPHVRAMVSFRLYHASHVPGVYRPDAMDDIWLEYDGLRDQNGFPPRLGSLPPLPVGIAQSNNGPALLAAAAALVNMPTAGANGPARPAGPTKVCAACNLAHRPDSRFCSNCGRPL